jgi:DNA replication protein DnaC
MFKNFIYRDDGINIAINASNQNFYAFNKNKSSSINKQDFNNIVINGGSGTGKTRGNFLKLFI